MGLGLIIQRRSHLPSWGGGRNQSECPAGMDRNRWPESVGISGRNASEYADKGLLSSTSGGRNIYIKDGENRFLSLP
jgi:hypothetical protein